MASFVWSLMYSGSIHRRQMGRCDCSWLMGRQKPFSRLPLTMDANMGWSSTYCFRQHSCLLFKQCLECKCIMKPAHVEQLEVESLWIPSPQVSLSFSLSSSLFPSHSLSCSLSLSFCCQIESIKKGKWKKSRHLILEKGLGGSVHLALATSHLRASCLNSLCSAVSWR